ncbi:MAG: hypothetical protein EPO21_13235 [Chloroflexota bacterium]|nr:MAG: hypothetical protein EPO21_13235 [Chloroflexota bacterium]
MKKRTQHLITDSTEHLILTPLGVALEEFLIAKKIENLSPKTLAGYDWVCQQFIVWARQHGQPGNIQEIEPDHIRKWIAFLQGKHEETDKKLSDVSIQTYFRTVRAWFNWAEKDELITLSPFSSKRIHCPKAVQKIKPAFTKQQMSDLLRACDGPTDIDVRDRAILLLLFDTGIRASELCNAQLVNLQPNRLKVDGKGAKERFVPISPKVDRAIRHYKRTRPCDTSETTLFLSTRGGPLTTSGLYQMIERRAKAAGIALKGVHLCRHTFALHWAAASGALHGLQAILGHESSAMSMKYGRMANTGIEELHCQYSPVAQMEAKRTGKENGPRR